MLRSIWLFWPWALCHAMISMVPLPAAIGGSAIPVFSSADRAVFVDAIIEHALLRIPAVIDAIIEVALSHVALYSVRSQTFH